MSFAKFTVAAAAAFIGLGMAASQAEGLPDLGGQTVVVVTENAYPPLQFIDPKTGDQIGWEYDAMNEIAKRLNFTVEYQNTSWDAMIQSVSDGQYEIGMTGISIKEDRKEEGRFLRSLHALGNVHAGARRRGEVQRRGFLRGVRGRAGGRAARHHAVLCRRL
jgi:polar amino acid transport system substrate-binding protein